MNDELDRCECGAVLELHEAGVCDGCDAAWWERHWEREAEPQT